MRDEIIDGVNLKLVWKIIDGDIPQLRNMLASL